MTDENKPPSIFKTGLIIIFTIIVGVVAYFYSPTKQHYNPSEQHNSASDERYAPTVVIMPKKEDPVAEATDSYTAREKEQYVAERSDLAAQWATARYTFVGLIMGGMGLLFIILTLRESSKAAYFTNEALKETKLNSRRELRAYLSVHVIAKNINDTEYPTIHIHFQNHGVSPAMNISCHCRGMGADETFEYVVSIQPNDTGEIIWPLEDLDMKDDGDIENFKIRIKYSDIFNGKRWVNADFLVTSDSFPTSNSFQTAVQIGANEVIRGGRPVRETTEIPLVNPNHSKERRIGFRYYTDDLQEEAENYEEANNQAS